MSNTGGLIGSGGHLDMAEIFQLLESSTTSVVDETVELVRDNLGSTPDSWLLNSLVDFYIQSGNTHARNLLCMVRQHQHKSLMMRIDDHLQKVPSRIKTLNLLNHIIRNEPTWTHHIFTSRAFQSVLKCLQVDNDLPTITSALYVVATILPKVPTYVPNHLQTICNIFVRLAAWHTIQPVGASETNLIHVHSAVYALFLCLYGMYPCYFTKFLQQYFQVGSTAKGSGLSDKEKQRVFENSVSPMLDQVRLHPGLITESASTESSSERWRKTECQDIIADISKLTLDITENPAVTAIAERKLSSVSDVNDVSIQMLSNVSSKAGAKSCRAGSDFENTKLITEQSSEGVWSPSLAIGLSTPPHSRAMSPSPGLMLDYTQGVCKFDCSQKFDSEKIVDDDYGKSKSRPVSLNMSTVDAFVPNRPHQTASATSTPLKHFVPSLLLSSSHSRSNSQTSSPQKDPQRKCSDPNLIEHLEKDEAITVPISIPDKPISQSDSALEKESSMGHSANKSELENNATKQSKVSYLEKGASEEYVNISCKDIVSACQNISDFTPGLQPNPDNPMSTSRQQQSNQTNEAALQFIPVNKLLNLKTRKKYVEQTPNELLDMHVGLIAEAYDKYRNRFPVTSHKDIEWQINDVSAGHPSSEVMYLRSQVLQMHCAMLYERHRREQHALRARKLMRKVYDTTAIEEKVKALTSQLTMKSNEIENYRSTIKSCRSELRSKEEKLNKTIEMLKKEIKEMKTKNQETEIEKKLLEKEKKSIWEDCERLKDEFADVSSKLFEVETKYNKEKSHKELLSKMEAKVRELQLRLFESNQSNSMLQNLVHEAKSECKAQNYETKVLYETCKRELENVKAKYLNDQKKYDSTRINLEKTESCLQREREIVSEQKNYLENVKSLARGQIKAMEAKYNAQKHICQRLEIQVMELYSRLTALEGELGDGERTSLTSGPRSIKATSALQSDSRYQHIYSSTPQLSPPMRGSFLSESTQPRLGSKGSESPTTATAIVKK